MKILLNFFFIFSSLVLSFNLSHSESIGEAVGKVSNSVYSYGSSSLQRVISSFGGDGETEVGLTAGENMQPLGFISITREIKETDNSMFFNQIQLNNYQVRGKDRQALNFGLGYRVLSEDDSYFYGGNVFFDVDSESNTRASIGAELKASPFSITANMYEKISGDNKVGSVTERTLSGYDLIVVGQVPFIPWAHINFTNYKWDKIKNSKDSSGNRVSGEFYLNQNIMFAAGIDDNNISGTDEFIKLSYIWPGKETKTMSDGLVSKTAFVESNVKKEILSKIRRNNRIILEVEGEGVIISRLD